MSQTSLSISFKGTLTSGLLNVTGEDFFFFPNRNILARTAVTPTTTTPMIIGTLCKRKKFRKGIKNQKNLTTNLLLVVKLFRGGLVISFREVTGFKCYSKPLGEYGPTLCQVFTWQSYKIFGQKFVNICPIKKDL